jgi:hypothetical protein
MFVVYLFMLRFNFCKYEMKIEIISKKIPASRPVGDSKDFHMERDSNSMFTALTISYI